MMKKRLEDLQKLKCYTEGIDKDLTMILQTFQWDRKTLLQNPPLVTCKYNSNHKVPPDTTEEHEKECFLRKNGYSKDDQLLPEPLDLESSTLVKLKKEDIQQIITNASRTDPSFKKGVGSGDAEPMSLERLQVSYSADERRAIHDAVVSAAPSCHDLADLALLSAGGDDKSAKVILSRQEILLELRNMRRRRTKYRVAAKSRNYSDVLRDVIRTQMEHYNDGKNEETEPTDTVGRDNSQRDTRNDRPPRPEPKDGRHRYDGKIVPQPIQIKIEKEDSTERNYRDNNHKDKSDRAYRHETGSKDRRDRDVDRHRRDDRSRERRNEEVERSQRYGEHSRKRRLDDDHKERRHYYEESRDRKRDDEPDREYRTDKQSKKDSSHKDRLEYQVKIEPGLEEDRRDFQRETSRERRHKDKRDKTHKHKDKKEKRRDRERSKEGRRDDRYEERTSERIYIKQEREDGARRDTTNEYEKEKADRKHKSKSRRHDRSRRDGSFGGYYDGASEEIYDPHKKIKKEK